MSVASMMAESIKEIDGDVDGLFRLFVKLPGNSEYLGKLMHLHDHLDENIVQMKYLTQLLLKREEDYDTIRDHLLDD